MFIYLRERERKGVFIFTLHFAITVRLLAVVFKLRGCIKTPVASTLWIDRQTPWIMPRRTLRRFSRLTLTFSSRGV
jgi:hypothetical protein